jgi:hypothetical protein
MNCLKDIGFLYTLEFEQWNGNNALFISLSLGSRDKDTYSAQQSRHEEMEKNNGPSHSLPLDSIGEDNPPLRPTYKEEERSLSPF